MFSLSLHQIFTSSAAVAPAISFGAASAISDSQPPAAMDELDETPGVAYLDALPIFDRVLPRLEGTRPELRFASDPSMLHKLLDRAVGREHWVYGAMGLGANAYSIALAHMHYAMHAGLKAYLKEQLDYASSHDLIPVEENRFIRIARRHFLHGIELYAKAMAIDLIIEGAEKIPKDGIVFQLAASHASIFPDFLFGWADPASAPVADVDNFSFDRRARRSGSAFYFDLLGLPLLSRYVGGEGEERHRRVLAQDTLGKRREKLVMIHGVRPIFFGQGGRVSTAYNDDGSQAPAGFYSNAPDPKKPGVYFQAGGVVIAAAKLAKQTGRPVSLMLVSMRGSEFVMPKDRTRTFPFVAAARSRQRLTYRVVDVLTINPGERKLSAIAKRAERLLKEDLDIDGYLDGVVEGWAAGRGDGALGEAFQGMARTRVSLYAIADRIRSIHPRHRSRDHFKGRLFEILSRWNTTGEPQKEEVDRLLADVTAAMKSLA